MSNRYESHPSGVTLGSRAYSSYEYLKLVEATGQIGFWMWNFVTGAQHWSPGMRRMFGFDDSPLDPSVEELMDLP